MEEVVTHSKFDTLRSNLKPTSFGLDVQNRERAEAILEKADFPNRKK